MKRALVPLALASVALLGPGTARADVFELGADPADDWGVEGGAPADIMEWDPEVENVVAC